MENTNQSGSNTHIQYVRYSLSLGAICLMVMGLYFVFIRPPLLPEDIQYINASAVDIPKFLPGIHSWLSKVFLVMGGYIFSNGILIFYISLSFLKEKSAGFFITIFLSNVCSIFNMTLVNFMINSDFKWVLLLLNFPWVISLVLYKKSELK